MHTLAPGALLPRAFWILSALLVLSAPARGADGAPGDRELAAGKRLLGEASDAKALQAFRQALEARKSSKAPAPKIAEVHVYIGITHFNLLQEDAAREQFRKALKLDPSVTLPDAVSPKIAEAFAELKKELSEAKPKEPANTPPPTTPTPIAPRHQELSALGQLWPAWTTLALAAAAGGVGLALGLVARSKAGDAADKRMYYPDAQSLHDTASGMALGANILYGVAGAAAIASAVLFYFGLSERSELRHASASVSPQPGGAVVTFQGVLW